MKASIYIQNLKCGGCAHTISTKLSEFDSISDIDVNVDDNNVSFNYDNVSDLELVKAKLKTLGYPTVDDKNDLLLKAKSYVSCASGKITK